MAISGTDWLEVPTIYKAYVSGLSSPQNVAWNMVLTYLDFRILEFPLSLLFHLFGDDYIYNIYI